jgi:hypothetical protein
MPLYPLNLFTPFFHFGYETKFFEYPIDTQGVELDMSLFYSSQHWNETYVTGGFSPHIRFGGFLRIIPPRLNTTILRGLCAITNYYNAVLHTPFLCNGL